MARDERRPSSRLATARARGAGRSDALAVQGDAAARGERAAVRAFLRAVGPSLLETVRRVLGAEHSEVDGVSQESAFAVLDALPRRRRHSIVLHVVNRVALRTAVNTLRRERRRERSSEHEPSAHSPTIPVSDDALARPRLDVEAVRRLLAVLPQRQGEIFALSGVLSYGVREVAELTDEPLDTVRAELHAAQRALAFHLRTHGEEAEQVVEAADLRALSEVRQAFASEGAALVGDEERIECLIERVLACTPRVRWSPRAVLAARSLLLALLIGGVAVAAIELSRWRPRGGRSRLTRSSLAGDQRLVPVAPEVTASAPSATSTISLPPAPQKAEPTPSALSKQARSRYPSASELFGEARAARVAGDVTQAVAISERLEQTFPNSKEGIRTHLSLGLLYLEQGRAASALAEYKLYRHIGDPTMMAEALWGEAQALQRLGKAVDERRALVELLARFPQSAYVAAAEQRLAVLKRP